MSSPMVSRWPVLVTTEVTPDDVDASGLITEEAARRIWSEASAAYFELCETVSLSDLDVRTIDVRRGSASPTDVVSVSAGVVEIFRESFAMRVRIRPSGTDGVVADVSSVLSTGTDVPIRMRDEFIALAQNASFMH